MSTSDVKVIGDYTAAISIDGSTHYLLIQPGSSSTAYNKINRNVFLGVSGQPADISTAQNITNKTLDNTNTITLKDTLFTLQDNSDTTKQAQFQLSGITTATTRTYTLPNASSTLADISTAQTFTNKTLTSPAITGGTIDNSTITVDSIGEHTSANGVTIDGLNIKDGALNTNNSVVTSNITDAAVTPAKLQAGTGSGWTWQSWSPTWVNLTVGNGSVTAKYLQTGKLIQARITVLFGTTSAVSGDVTFTLPVTAVASPGSANMPPVGNIQFLNSSGPTIVFGFAALASITTAVVRASNASSTYGSISPLTSTVPFGEAWAQNDEIHLEIFYEGA